jgi:quinol monooxygenase YgiN
MYVRVTPYSGDPAREQEVVRFAEERLIPALRQLPGFRRYLAAGDRATGRGVTISEWDDQEHAEHLRPALGGLMQEIADLGIQLEAAQVYEVTVQS